jgi:hypothetical protein
LTQLIILVEFLGLDGNVQSPKETVLTTATANKKQPALFQKKPEVGILAKCQVLHDIFQTERMAVQGTKWSSYNEAAKRALKQFGCTAEVDLRFAQFIIMTCYIPLMRTESGLAAESHWDAQVLATAEQFFVVYTLD